jgi:hypothetical protein
MLHSSPPDAPAKGKSTDAVVQFELGWVDKERVHIDFLVRLFDPPLSLKFKFEVKTCSVTFQHAWRPLI